MLKRKIITIDSKKCNGCALCIPNCPEGAIQIIDQKARLISDLFCDGLGACIGHCPQGAITIEEREAVAYDEKKVMANIVKQGPNVIKAHLKHLKEHNELVYLKQGMDFLKEKKINIALDELCSHGENTTGGCPG
ncbi:MAG: 4Fe-4S binding protein, partial [Candidatus Omnitrophota bacterium]|nr:4Fe-4S binding protein [Candidatus Omnitrophota bacterium]